MWVWGEMGTPQETPPHLAQGDSSSPMSEGSSGSACVPRFIPATPHVLSPAPKSAHLPLLLSDFVAPSLSSFASLLEG